MESLRFPLDSPPFRRANFPKFRPCKSGLVSHSTLRSHLVRRVVEGEEEGEGASSIREERASCGEEEMRKEGRSGRAGALRTGEERRGEEAGRAEAEVLSLSFSLSLSL